MSIANLALTIHLQQQMYLTTSAKAEPHYYSCAIDDNEA